MNKYKYALFDFDGTLFDTSEGIEKAVAYSLEKLGITDYDDSVLSRFIGPPLTDSYTEHFGFSYEKSVEAVGLFREYYHPVGSTECKIYDGAAEMIKTLRKAGITCAVATSKPEFFAKKIAARFSVDSLFDVISGAELNSVKQDKSESIIHALEALDIKDRSKVIMIGDRSHDIIGAKKCGLDSMGVLYGFGSEDELRKAGADYIAADMNDIVHLLID